MKIYIETYGCQMNQNDTEIVQAILATGGHEMTDRIDDADAILMNTCSVRENAESRIFKRISNIAHLARKNNRLIVGVIGCMAERLHSQLIDSDGIVSLVVGPDEYRNLPALLEKTMSGAKSIAVELSRVETYDDIPPLRTEGIAAWLSIMRGCNNFCSYCVVPGTRGRERSRQMDSLIDEAEKLYHNGYKELTLLGQNVNSYRCPVTKVGFAELISEIANAVPEMRIRFTTSHPKDLSDELIYAVSANSNICKHIHLPVQSGSTRILKSMNRKYSREDYLILMENIKNNIPEISLTTDIIAGYPGETDEDHKHTLSLMETVRYDGAFMFKYSPRDGTKAYEMTDDVPDDLKLKRLNEIIDLQNKISYENNQMEIGRVHEILVEGPSKKNIEEWMGRSDNNKVAIFPNANMKYNAGDKIKVKIQRATSATLFGSVI